MPLSNIGGVLNVSRLPLKSTRRSWSTPTQLGRHLLVDTEGFVLKAKVMSAKVMDYEGINELLDHVKGLFPRLSQLWLDAAYSGEDKGGDWVEKALG
jgi:hypothetical protein